MSTIIPIVADYNADDLLADDASECRNVLTSLSDAELIDPDREPIEGIGDAIITLGYSYIPQLDDKIVWRNRDVVKAIRHYVLFTIWRQDKEGIDIALSDREEAEFERMLKRLNIRRQRDFAEPLYDLGNYKSIWRQRT